MVRKKKSLNTASKNSKNTRSIVINNKRNHLLQGDSFARGPKLLSIKIMSIN